jgi:hypothetical protein
VASSFVGFTVSVKLAESPFHFVPRIDITRVRGCDALDCDFDPVGGGEREVTFDNRTGHDKYQVGRPVDKRTGREQTD